MAACVAACDPAAHVSGPRPVTEARAASLSEAPAYTYDEDVQPILMEYCSPCHEGTTPDGCVASACMAFFYESLTWYSCCALPYTPYATEPIEGCGNTRVADCSLARVHSFERVGKDPLPADQVEILEEWIAQGMPKGNATTLTW